MRLLPTGCSGYRAGCCPPGTTPVASTVPWSRSSPSAPRSPSLGRFPVLAGADLEVERGEIVLLPGPERRREDHASCGPARACSQWSRAPATCSGHDLTDAGRRRALRRRVGLLGPRQRCSTTTSRWPRTCSFWGRAAGASDAEVDAAMVRMGLDGRLAEVPGRPPLGRSAPPHVDRRPAGPPARAVAARRAPRRARPERPRRWSTSCCAGASAAGATVLLASHELDRAGSVATRVVEVVAGSVRAPGARPAPDPEPETDRVA